MVSIILPIYNKEKELEQCLKSILNQTYKNIEIILVNDGSKDSSKDICERFLKKDERIKLINKKNEGVELARITGLENVNGNYITFVDPDDWIPNNAIELLIKSIKSEDADVSFGKFCRVLDKYGLIKREIKSNIYSNLVIEKNELMNKYYGSFCGWGDLPVNMCGKLYKKSLIDSVNYQPVGISHGEDLCFNLQILPHANKIVSIPDTIYFYRWGGITNNINKNLFKDACTAYNFKLKMFEEHNSKESYAKASVELCNFFITYIDTYLRFTNLSDAKIKSIISKEIKNKTLQKAVRIPRYDWFLNNKLYNCIKKQDVDKFLEIKKHGRRKKKLKSKMIYFVSKILN